MAAPKAAPESPDFSSLMEDALRIKACLSALRALESADLGPHPIQTLDFASEVLIERAQAAAERIEKELYRLVEPDDAE